MTGQSDLPGHVTARPTITESGAPSGPLPLYRSPGGAVRDPAVLRGNDVRIPSVSGRVRYAGLRNVVRVTDGHEAEAKAAQLRKPPNRIGLLILRLLGFRGPIAQPTGWGGHAGRSHEHPVHHEHAALGE